MLSKEKELFILRTSYYIFVEENCEWKAVLCYNFSEESRNAQKILFFRWAASWS